MQEILLTSSALLFVLGCLYILFELTRINKYVHRWELDSAKLIPFLFGVLYLYIAAVSPEIHLARTMLRFALGISLGISFPNWIEI